MSKSSDLLELKNVLFLKPDPLFKNMAFLAKKLISDKNGPCYGKKSENISASISRILKGDQKINDWLILGIFSLINQSNLKDKDLIKENLNEIFGLPPINNYKASILKKIFLSRKQAIGAVDFCFGKTEKASMEQLCLALELFAKFD